MNTVRYRSLKRALTYLFFIHICLLQVVISMEEKNLLPESEMENDSQPDGDIISASSFITASKRDQTTTFRVFLCLLLCLSAIVCKFFYPAGSELMQHWIIGTGNERIQVAVSSFDAALQEGRPVEDAISVFYQQITHENES